MFQPYPFNSVGGRPGAAGSFACKKKAKKKKSHSPSPSSWSGGFALSCSWPRSFFRDSAVQLSSLLDGPLASSKRTLIFHFLVRIFFSALCALVFGVFFSRPSGFCQPRPNASSISLCSSSPCRFSNFDVSQISGVTVAYRSDLRSLT